MLQRGVVYQEDSVSEIEAVEDVASGNCLPEHSIAQRAQVDSGVGDVQLWVLLQIISVNGV